MTTRQCNVYRFDIIDTKDADLFCINKTIFMLAYSVEDAKGKVSLAEKYSVEEIEGPCVLYSIG
ncbi:MAG: hypothetical protein ACKPFF_38770 [Planktothrix sp.]